MADKVELLRSLSIDRADARRPAARPRLLVLGGVALASALLGGAVGWFARPIPDPRPAPAPVASAGAAPARSAGLVASGYVVARRSATVAAEVTGRVVQVLVEEGQFVRAGQVLAVLEPTLARAERDTAVARAGATAAELAEARRVVARTNTLAASGYVSEASVTAAQSHLDQAQAQDKASQAEAARTAAQLERYSIRAPFAGVITNKAAQPGEIISPISAGGGFTRTGICTIVDMQSLEVEVDVSESFIAKVHEGERVEAVLDAYPDITFPAHVIAIIPSANRERATFRVRIGFDRLDPRILPEMAIKVTLLNQDQSPKSKAG